MPVTGTTGDGTTSRPLYKCDVGSGMDISLIPNEITDQTYYTDKTRAKLVGVFKGYTTNSGTTNFTFFSPGVMVKCLIDPEYFDSSLTTVSRRNYLPILKTFNAMLIVSVDAAVGNITNNNDFRIFNVTATNYDPYSTGDTPLFYCTEGSSQTGTGSPHIGFGNKGNVVVRHKLESGSYLLGRQYNKASTAATVRTLLIFDIGGI